MSKHIRRRGLWEISNIQALLWRLPESRTYFSILGKDLWLLLVLHYNRNPVICIVSLLTKCQFYIKSALISLFIKHLLTVYYRPAICIYSYVLEKAVKYYILHRSLSKRIYNTTEQKELD